ncbi:GbsR/MarR family transcriptional regulator [Thiosocius teredinicola]|uniref:GbsR/MarR family transcriptional regulator n=1 Tax=Thiosocius teredinicola TaxID=1973002 RepID=UPI000990D4B3
MKLSSTMERFVMHWGEMGSRWGVNRTVAQIHALLFLSEAPLHAEEISETLGVARSNVSTSLRELQSWELVHIVHMKGDRRDHFEAQHDVREIFRTVAEGRKRREIDPTLTTLRACVSEAGGETPKVARGRMKDTLDFMELMANVFEEVKALPNAGLTQWLKTSLKAKKLLS